ncbi:putative CopG family antitoxin [Neorhizobium sp. 2083]|uniref:DUF6364 family protein n=1 Tax=Neorhizobium sp. 2083 TaxID=2817762 RepID=UPI00285F6B54|nr:DUF6364 family protein [Neorhizobium sp. 2083]MDR6818597.1 putative CopG family antitoxin [Neorhizobium sp. 2083]
MKNVTIALDDEVYELAAARAAEKNTSVSSLIASLIRQMEGKRPLSPEEFQKSLEREEELRKRIVGISAKDNLPRDELHRRR